MKDFGELAGRGAHVRDRRGDGNTSTNVTAEFASVCQARVSQSAAPVAFLRTAIDVVATSWFVSSPAACQRVPTISADASARAARGTCGRQAGCRFRGPGRLLARSRP